MIEETFTVKLELLYTEDEVSLLMQCLLSLFCSQNNAGRDLTFKFGCGEQHYWFGYQKIFINHHTEDLVVIMYDRLTAVDRQKQADN